MQKLLNFSSIEETEQSISCQFRLTADLPCKQGCGAKQCFPSTKFMSQTPYSVIPMCTCFSHLSFSSSVLLNLLAHSSLRLTAYLPHKHGCGAVWHLLSAAYIMQCRTHARIPFFHLSGAQHWGTLWHPGIPLDPPLHTTYFAGYGEQIPRTRSNVD